jgi:ABC-type multidrug transport system ATPase subunit
MNITTENLGKRFNREWVFRNFNYEFNAGHTYAVVGPNGSGKSTMMQVLWGQMPPSTGSVTYLNTSQSEIYKSLAIAAPYMDLIDEFTLQEMIRFHFKFKKSRVVVEEVLEKTGLESSRQKLLSSFSSGMRQRLKLALAFYSETEILFLDEPCTNLDKKSIEWYHRQLDLISSETLVFIASNQDFEYPSAAQKVEILSYK